MTPTDLEASIKQFCSHVFAALTDKVTVKQQILSHAPLTVRVGVKIAGLEAADVKSVLTGSALRAAWLTIWPDNAVGGCNPSSIATAGDDKHVVFDLVFYSVKLETPDALTAGA